MTNKTPSILVLVGAGLIAGVTASSACTPGGAPEACDVCPGSNAYFCDVPSSNNIICANDDAQANGLCPEGWTSVVNCQGGTGGQQAWDPGSMIAYDAANKLYEVDSDLVDVIAADGYVLYAQDTARLVPQSGGFFRLENVGADDLAAHMGLQNNDVIKEINGVRLLSWQDYATAITQLVDTTYFTLKYTRGGVTRRNTYRLL